VDSKAECDQLNLAHHTKLKQTTASAHFVQNRFKICEGRPDGTFQHFYSRPNLTSRYEHTDDGRGTVCIGQSVFCRFVARYELSRTSSVDKLDITV